MDWLFEMGWLHAFAFIIIIQLSRMIQLLAKIHDLVYGRERNRKEK